MPLLKPQKNDREIQNMRIEYTKLHAPTTSWGNIISFNLGLPGLRAYWPMNIADESDDTIDISGMSHKLIHYP